MWATALSSNSNQTLDKYSFICQIELHVNFKILSVCYCEPSWMWGPLKTNNIRNLFNISFDRCIFGWRPLAVSSTFSWHRLNGLLHFNTHRFFIRSAPHGTVSAAHSSIGLFPPIKIIWCIFVALILIGFFRDFQGNDRHLCHISPSFRLENPPSTRQFFSFCIKIFYSILLWKFKWG